MALPIRDSATTGLTRRTGILKPSPFAHEHTLMPALGMKARDPAFLDEQKRHLGELVRAMTRPARERRTRR